VSLFYEFCMNFLWKKLLINMDKFVDIKIRAKYRDMLKEYCKDNGYKMYACVESLIEKNCRKKKVLLVDRKS